MVAAAFRSVEFMENPDGYENGSVGRELRRLLRMYFDTEAVQSLAARASSAPGDFLAELQAQSQLFA
jgi:hypothetical protein